LLDRHWIQPDQLAVAIAAFLQTPLSGGTEETIGQIEMNEIAETTA